MAWPTQPATRPTIRSAMGTTMRSMLGETREMRCGRMDSLFRRPKHPGGTLRAMPQGSVPYAQYPKGAHRYRAAGAEISHDGVAQSVMERPLGSKRQQRDIGRNIKRHRHPHIGLSLERCETAC